MAATRDSDSNGLPDDCWEIVISKLINRGDGVNRRKHYLPILSLVSKQLLSIINNYVHSFIFIYNPRSSFLFRLFKRFPNLTSLDFSTLHINARDDLNATLSRITPSVSLTSLNLSNHSTFPILGLQIFLKNNYQIKSTLTSLICSNLGSLKFTDLIFIADSFPFLQQLDISFPKQIIMKDIKKEDYNNAIKYLTQKLSKLRKVNLSGNFYIDDSSFIQLCMNCEFLEEIVMFKCPSLTHAGIASAICYRHNTLKSLSVSNFKEEIRNEELNSFVRSLASLHRQLTCLDLSFSCIPDSLLCSIAELEGYLPLRKLVLQCCSGFTYTGISCFLSKCPSLQHLDLQHANFLNDRHFDEMCIFFPDLVSINVNGCVELTNSTLFALLKNCPLLAEIRMESTKIGFGSIPFVVVCPQVKSLHLASNSWLQDKDINMFAFMFPNMDHLDLSSCPCISDRGISIVLKRCRMIRHFNFAFCPQSYHFSINFKASKLEVLNLSHSRINDKVLYAISKVCPQLLQLDLKHCYNVTEKGVRMVVINCTHLREINLLNCHQVSTKIVSEMIHLRPSLRKITAMPNFCSLYCNRKLLFL